MFRRRRLLVITALVALALAIAAWGGRHMLEQRAETQARHYLALAMPHAEVSWDRLRISLPHLHTVLEDVTLTYQEHEEPVRVDEIRILALDRHHAVPHHLHARVTGVAVPLSQLPPAQRMLAEQLGFDNTLHADYELDYRFQPKRETLELHRLGLTLVDGGALSLTASLENIRPQSLQQRGPAELARVRLREGRLVYHDDSLVGRARSWYGNSNGEGADLTDELETYQDPEAPDEYRQALEELRQFLREPRRLEITSLPENPVTLPEVVTTAVLQPRRLPRLLGLQVTASQ